MTSATPDLLVDFVYAKLTSAVTVNTSTFSVDNTSLFPSNNALASGNFWMTIESGLNYPNTFEIVRVTSVDFQNNIVTVVRGERSPISAHESGLYMKSTVSADMLNLIRFGYSDYQLPTSTAAYSEGDRFYSYKDHCWYYVNNASAGTWQRLGNASYQGEYDRNTLYRPGDLVTHNDSLYSCTTLSDPTTASPLVGYIGVHTSDAGAAFDTGLPDGSAAGDYVVLVLAVATGGSTVALPTGFTSIESVQDSDGILASACHTLTTADINNGAIHLPANGTDKGGYIAYLLNFGPTGWSVSDQDFRTSHGDLNCYGFTPGPATGSVFRFGMALTTFGAVNFAYGDNGGTPFVPDHNSTVNSPDTVNVGYMFENYTGDYINGGVFQTDQAADRGQATLALVGPQASASFDPAKFARIGDLGDQTLTTITNDQALFQVTGSCVLIDATNNNVTVDLTSFPSTAPTITFKRIDASSHTVSLHGTFDGATNYALPLQWRYVQVVPTATNGAFYIIAAG